MTSQHKPASLTAASQRLLPLAALAAATLWAYWSSLQTIAAKWAHDPEYSHGYLVPLFALGLLWLRRELVEPEKLRPSWWGVPVLLAAAALRWAGAHYYFEWFDFLSIVPCVAGICLLAGGWHAFRWAWPAVGFLFFMLPLPYTLEVALRGPLRQIGTMASTYLMQTVGLAAIAEGNVVVVHDVRIGVDEACSGLRMLMIFFALSTAVALVSRERPIWERLVIVASAVPIALISNITRITTTGMLHATGHSELADLVFHDLAGWLMMPLALALLWLELAILARLLIVEEQEPLTAGLSTSSESTGESQRRAAAGKPEKVSATQ